MRVLLYWPFMRSEEALLGPALAATGLDVTILTLDRPGAPAAVDEPGLCIAPVLPEVGDHRRGTLRWLLDRYGTYRSRSRIRRAFVDDADIVHVWFVNRFVDAFAIPRLARRRRTFVHVHDVLPHAARLPAPMERALLRRIYRSDAVLTVHHRSLADELRDRFGATRASVVPLMVRPRPATTPHPGTRRALFFGTFRANKGIDILLDAIDRAGADIEWRIAGRGEPELEAAVATAADRHANLDVRIGWSDEDTKAADYDWADVVVLPYTAFESQSGVLHDAYAHGRAVVVTDVGALGTSVAEDGTGIVLPAADAARVAAAVREVLDDAARRSAFEAAAASVAHARRPDAIAATLHDLYTRPTV